MNNWLIDTKIIDLPRILDNRGNLSFFESTVHIPFEISRVFWVYDVPGGETRGGHSYRENKELIVALSGSFDVVLDDGISQRKVTLNRSYYGLYVPNGIWRHMENFSTNSLALIAASMPYDDNDYVRELADFVSSKSKLV
jgi:dTDP-4-dehydrorhamnose 3,5-epimerase-like enzyme